MTPLTEGNITRTKDFGERRMNLIVDVVVWVVWAFQMCFLLSSRQLNGNFPGDSVVENVCCQCRNTGLIWVRNIPGEGEMATAAVFLPAENPMDRRGWQVTVHVWS